MKTARHTSKSKAIFNFTATTNNCELNIIFFFFSFVFLFLYGIFVCIVHIKQNHEMIFWISALQYSNTYILYFYIIYIAKLFINMCVSSPVFIFSVMKRVLIDGVIQSIFIRRHFYIEMFVLV